jgi:CRP-like cAMP-binding protein
VVAEQIQPLTPDDIATIHEAQSYPLDRAYEGYVERGKEALGTAETGSLIESEVALIRPYQFVAGLEGVPALGEYLVYRKIQEKKSLSVDEAKRISQEFMRMPRKVKSDLTRYIDDLLLPIQTESGAIQKSGLDLICQNISGALFGTISNEHLNRIFSREKTFLKDDVICEQGSVGTDMYYLKEGEVGVYLDDIFMAALGPGEIFGEMSLFYEVNKSATIRVSSVRAKVGLLNREGLENLFKGGQPYARDLIHRLYSILPERLRNLNDKYKTAIRSLYLILHGDVSRMPNLDHDPFESPGNKQAFLPILSDEDKRLFYRDIRKFGPDQTVFEEGERGDGAYFIIQGRMKVTALSDDAKQITLGELGEGDIFGEMSLIDDKPRSASVVTLTPCEAAFVTKTAFDQFIETGADLATRLMGFICLSLFRRILRLDRLYSDIKQQIRNEGDG